MLCPHCCADNQIGCYCGVRNGKSATPARRGRGEQGWLTYRFSPRSNIQFGYQHNSVDKAFLQGGTLQDFNLRTDLMLTHALGISGFVQHETWNFPVLSPTAQSYTTA